MFLVRSKVECFTAQSLSKPKRQSRSEVGCLSGMGCRPSPPPDPLLAYLTDDKEASQTEKTVPFILPGVLSGFCLKIVKTSYISVQKPFWTTLRLDA